MNRPCPWLAPKRQNGWKPTSRYTVEEYEFQRETKVLDQVWTDAAIRYCLQNGIDHFFLAPGSRCTPLTLAVARNENAHVIQHFDERGLAFAALGYARATGKPGIFICTSGTAVANAFPAVIEAASEGLPMLLWTADRPEELRGSGPNQTIDQRNLFGDYPSDFIDLAVAEDQDTPEDPRGHEYLRQALQRIVAASKSGPAHLNWMFREPFSIVEPDSTRSVWSFDIEPETAPPSTTIQLSGKVLIALGDCRPEEASQVLSLAKEIGAPVLSDITSGVKGLSFELPAEFSLPRPDTILHLGGRIVSKSWLQWTKSLFQQPVDFIHVTPSGRCINPNGLPQRQIHAPLSSLRIQHEDPAGQDSFTARWLRAGAEREQVLHNYFGDQDDFSEPAIAYALSQICPQSDGLFIGNSTPIRDMDWYGDRQQNENSAQSVRLISANRGASGIDGLLATASGYAAGLKSQTTVVVGDLSALHDLNSLALVAKSSWPLIVIVINNQGGHIFDLLPIRESQHFETFFNTPHEIEFQHAANMFGIEYRSISEMDDFRKVYREAIEGNQAILLELKTERARNVAVRKQIAEAIHECSESL